MLARDGVRLYIAHLGSRADENNLSRSTVTYYSCCLSRFVAPLGAMEIGACGDSDWLLAWHTMVTTGAALRPRSVATYREVCCSWLDWLVAVGELSAHSLRKVRTPPLDAAVRPRVSLDAFLGLVAAADRLPGGERIGEAAYLQARARALLWTAWSGLLRRRELWSLRIDHLRIDEDPPRLLVECGKGRRGAWVPLSHQAATALRQFLVVRGDVGSAWLWVNGGAERLRMGLTAWPRLLQQLAALSGVDPSQCKTHGTRRGGATEMHRSGVDIATVCAYLRHASTRTTEMYVEAGPARVAEVRNWMDRATAAQSVLPVPIAAPPSAPKPHDPVDRPRALIRRRQPPKAR